MDEDQGVRDWNLLALAACEPLRGRAGFYVAPYFPNWVVERASRSYLSLRPDEFALALIDRSPEGAPDCVCALTTQRICWAGEEAGDVSASGPRDDVRGRSLEYGELPEAIGEAGVLARTIELGEETARASRRLDRPALEALAGVLATMRRGARTGDLAGAVPPEAVDRVRRALATAEQRAAEIRRVTDEFRSFHALARAATPRVPVTRVLVAACVLVFVAMGLAGVSWSEPGARDLFAWGANQGVAVVRDGQAWRLLTAMFLHGGLLHLAFNMWCLWQVGPLIERLYGNVGFALLYLGAGLGGSLASAAAHPLDTGVGASGAIFGLFGGLLAFLLIHRKAIPASVLKPLRGSGVAFVVYNSLFSLLIPQIDNAAHFGGLATGFVAGLVLNRPWPPARAVAALARQLVGGLMLAAGLALAGVAIEAPVRRQAAVGDFDTLMQTLNPLLGRYDRAEHRLQELLELLDRSRGDDPRLRGSLEMLIAETAANQDELNQLAATDADQKAMLASLTESHAEFLRALRALRRFLDAPHDQALFDGPEGFTAYQASSIRSAERFVALRAAYIKKHGRDVEGAKPGS